MSDNKNEEEVVVNKWQQFSEESAKASRTEAESDSEKTPVEGEVHADYADFPGDEVNVEPSVTQAEASNESILRLQDQVEALKMKVATYQDQAARAVAEMENARRRAQKEVRDARLFANSSLIKSLLPVIDSLTRAQEGLDVSDPKEKSMLEGMVLTSELLEKTLVVSGLEVINPELGCTFNPDLHEAMSMVPNPDAQKNDVLQVLQKGYQLNGRVIRAAMGDRCQLGSFLLCAVGVGAPVVVGSRVRAGPVKKKPHPCGGQDFPVLVILTHLDLNQMFN